MNDPAAISDLVGIPFSTEQLAAITAPLEPGVIIAGAGTGKTTVMAARVVYLVASGQLNADQVLGLTFTRKAAGELAQRVDSALARAGFEPTMGDGTGALIMTYDAFAGMLVADYGLWLGLDMGQTLLDEATRFSLAAQALAQAEIPLEILGEYQDSTIITKMLALDSAMAAHLVDEAEVRSFDWSFGAELAEVRHYRGKPTKAVLAAKRVADEREELLTLVGAYRQLKTEYSAAEFADQMANAALLAEDQRVSAQLRERFKVVLLDEFQDTSAANARLLRGLFSGTDPASGRGHPVTAVGDPFQAIYGWRGASASNIGRFSEDFPRLDGQAAPSYQLTINRRSRTEILEAANRVSTPLFAEYPSQPGVVREGLKAPSHADGGVVDAKVFATSTAEIEWLAESILNEHDQATEWRKMAILVRRNGDIAPIYDHLVAAGIPVEIVGLGGLLQLPVIADLIAILTLISDVGANPQVAQLLSGPRWRIGTRDLALLGRRARQLTKERVHSAGADGASVDETDQACLLDAIADLGELPYSAAARKRFAAFGAEMALLRRYRDRSLAEILARVLESSGLIPELLADPSGQEGNSLAQVNRFVEIAADFVGLDGQANLAAFLAYLAIARDQGDGLDQVTPSEDNSVKLLTMHRAKGLEWDVVFVPGLVKEVFPILRITDNWTKSAQTLPAPLRGDAEWVCQLDELSSAELTKGYGERLKDEALIAETRLAYVAFTRAKRALHGSAHIWAPGLKNPRQLSPFIYSLSASPDRSDLSASTGTVGPAVGIPGQEIIPETNPLDATAIFMPWPQEADPGRVDRVAEFAALVQRAAFDLASGKPAHPTITDFDEAATVAAWRAAGEYVIATLHEQRAISGSPIIPSGLTVSDLVSANQDLDGFSKALRRPMPSPFTKEASLGTRFHQWVENYYQLSELFDVSEGSDDLDELVQKDDWAAERLAELTQAFQQGQFADRSPIALEEGFILLLAGHQIRGRIDAIFASRDPSYDLQVIDWKTTTQKADPLQLALYRLAVAQTHEIPVERVQAGFYHVIENRIEFPPLANQAELIKLITRLKTKPGH